MPVWLPAWRSDKSITPIRGLSGPMVIRPHHKEMKHSPSPLTSAAANTTSQQPAASLGLKRASLSMAWEFSWLRCLLSGCHTPSLPLGEAGHKTALRSLLTAPLSLGPDCLQIYNIQEGTAEMWGLSWAPPAPGDRHCSLRSPGACRCLVCALPVLSLSPSEDRAPACWPVCPLSPARHLAPSAPKKSRLN